MTKANNLSRHRISSGQHRVDCYVKWLRLKKSKEYRDASREIRLLRTRKEEAEARRDKAYQDYVLYLERSEPDSPEQQAAKQAYGGAETDTERVTCELTTLEERTCQQFGLCQWWDPDDAKITLNTASDLFSNASPLVSVIRPALQRRESAADRLIQTSSTSAWLDWRRHADIGQDGSLTVKINLNDGPLEQIEQELSRLLSFYRKPLKTRRRPGKDEEALETWSSYEAMKRFSTVAQQLKRRVNTVKGQYVRACLLIDGQRPTGSIKQRRVRPMEDPSQEFQNHFGSCTRCQKADTAEQMCPKYLAYVDVDSKAQRERLRDPSRFEEPNS